ncbi:hypothetical protein BYT27DRAFT_7196780 [Phlegmacium glaucopus]|nr:hypothetical protein BYT27DRAFT_7196780 [Phlegmacium glaucopus]
MSNVEANTSNSTDNAAGTNTEQSFSIQPHPAKTNDPADLQPSGGLRQGNAMDAFYARGPHVPSEDILKNLPEPLSREELQAKQAALKK